MSARAPFPLSTPEQFMIVVFHWLSCSPQCIQLYLSSRRQTRRCRRAGPEKTKNVAKKTLVSSRFALYVDVMFVLHLYHNLFNKFSIPFNISHPIEFCMPLRHRRHPPFLACGIISFFWTCTAVFVSFSCRWWWRDGAGRDGGCLYCILILSRQTLFLLLINAVPIVITASDVLLA